MAHARSDLVGYFGPGSMVWKVDREVVVLLGGGARALLMQVAHPLIAAAVAEHSRYRCDPLGRLRHTLEVSYAFAFADRGRARSLIGEVNRRHAHVRGALACDVGAHTAGTPYWALDPALLLWVYATLVDSSLAAYERFVGPLTEAERERYYAEGRRAGRVWGIPSATFPPTLRHLRVWMTDLIETGQVAVSDQGRAIARSILRPPVRCAPDPLTAPVRLLTVWMLPPALRAQFGFNWGPRREALLCGAAALCRAAMPHVPGALRDLPYARSAERRIQPPASSWLQSPSGG